MPHERFEFHMPASAEVVFDAFHYHCWKARWDSLVRDTHVSGDAPCPYVGAVTENAGKGMLGGLSMRTRFATYAPPRIAAATMIGSAFPFTHWAASMKHKPLDARRSVLIYTYTFHAGSPMTGWLLEPIVKCIFDWQTRRRFKRLQAFLSLHAAEIEQWRWQRDAESDH